MVLRSRFVKTSAEKRTRSSRPSSEPCEVASIAQLRSPPSSISRKLALEVDRLGVVRTRRPSLAADPALDRPEQTRPASGGRQDRVEQEGRRRLAVRARDPGDLKLLGRVPKNSSAAIAMAARASATTSCGTPSSSGLSTTSATAPFATASAREVVPVRARAGDAEEERARVAAAGVVGEVCDLDWSASHDVHGRERRDERARCPSRRESTRAVRRDPGARGQCLKAPRLQRFRRQSRHRHVRPRRVTLAAGRRPGEPYGVGEFLTRPLRARPAGCRRRGTAGRTSRSARTPARRRRRPRSLRAARRR